MFNSQIKKSILPKKNNFKKITNGILQKAVLQEREPSVLVFGANWSGNAEIMNNLMDKVAQEFDSNINFLEVDIEKHEDIASFFGVTTIPISMILKEGEVVGLVKGLCSAKEIRKKLLKYFVNSCE